MSDEVVAADDKWYCPACAYPNSNNMSKCTICNNAKPSPTAADATAAAGTTEADATAKFASWLNTMVKPFDEPENYPTSQQSPTSPPSPPPSPTALTTGLPPSSPTSQQSPPPSPSLATPPSSSPPPSPSLSAVVDPVAAVAPAKTKTLVFPSSLSPEDATNIIIATGVVNKPYLVQEHNEQDKYTIWIVTEGQPKSYMITKDLEGNLIITEVNINFGVKTIEEVVEKLKTQKSKWKPIYYTDILVFPSSLTPEDAEAKIEAAGGVNGRFLVKKLDEQDSYTLWVVHNGRIIDFKITTGDDKKLLLKGTTYGDATTIEEFVAALRTKHDGWPLAMNKPIYNINPPISPISPTSPTTTPTASTKSDLKKLNSFFYTVDKINTAIENIKNPDNFNKTAILQEINTELNISITSLNMLKEGITANINDDILSQIKQETSIRQEIKDLTNIFFINTIAAALIIKAEEAIKLHSVVTPPSSSPSQSSPAEEDKYLSILSTSGIKSLGLNIMAHFKIPSVENSNLIIASGKITNFEGNAIVNAANEGCLGGGGVDGAIVTAGGDVLRDERIKLKVESEEGNPKKIRCPTGSAKITTAVKSNPFGSLKVEHVIHAVGPVYPDKNIGESDNEYNTRVETEDGELKTAYEQSIIEAQKVQVKNIAFCIISGGVFAKGKNLLDIISIGLESIINKIKQKNYNNLNVYIVAFEDKDKPLLLAAAKQLDDTYKRDFIIFKQPEEPTSPPPLSRSLSQPSPSPRSRSSQSSPPSLTSPKTTTPKTTTPKTTTPKTTSSQGTIRTFNEIINTYSRKGVNFTSANFVEQLELCFLEFSEELKGNHNYEQFEDDVFILGILTKNTECLIIPTYFSLLIYALSHNNLIPTKIMKKITNPSTNTEQKYRFKCVLNQPIGSDPFYFCEVLYTVRDMKTKIYIYKNHEHINKFTDLSKINNFFIKASNFKRTFQKTIGRQALQSAFENTKLKKEKLDITSLVSKKDNILKLDDNAPYKFLFFDNKNKQIVSLPTILCLIPYLINKNNIESSDDDAHKIIKQYNTGIFACGKCTYKYTLQLVNKKIQLTIQPKESSKESEILKISDFKKAIQLYGIGLNNLGSDAVTSATTVTSVTDSLENIKILECETKEFNASYTLTSKKANDILLEYYYDADEKHDVKLYISDNGSILFKRFKWIQNNKTDLKWYISNFYNLNLDFNMLSDVYYKTEKGDDNPSKLKDWGKNDKNKSKLTIKEYGDAIILQNSLAKYKRDSNLLYPQYLECLGTFIDSDDSNEYNKIINIYKKSESGDHKDITNIQFIIDYHKTTSKDTSTYNYDEKKYIVENIASILEANNEVFIKENIGEYDGHKHQMDKSLHTDYINDDIIPILNKIGEIIAFMNWIVTQNDIKINKINGNKTEWIYIDIIREIITNYIPDTARGIKLEQEFTVEKINAIVESKVDTYIHFIDTLTIDNNATVNLNSYIYEYIIGTIVLGFINYMNPDKMRNILTTNFTSDEDTGSTIYTYTNIYYPEYTLNIYNDDYTIKKGKEILLNSKSSDFFWKYNNTSKRTKTPNIFIKHTKYVKDAKIYTYQNLSNYLTLEHANLLPLMCGNYYMSLDPDDKEESKPIFINGRYVIKYLADEIQKWVLVDELNTDLNTLDKKYYGISQKTWSHYPLSGDMWMFSKKPFNKEDLQKLYKEPEKIMIENDGLDRAVGAEKENVQQWVALYKYSKHDSNEIDIKEGDTLTNVEKENHGWSYVTKDDGTSGLVPTSYIEKKTVEDAAAAHTLPPKPWECIKDYTTEESDKININIGDDIVINVNTYTNKTGWVTGTNNTTNKTGFIPRTHIQPPIPIPMSKPYDIKADGFDIDNNTRYTDANKQIWILLYDYYSKDNSTEINIKKGDELRDVIFIPDHPLWVQATNDDNSVVVPKLFILEEEKLTELETELETEVQNRVLGNKAIAGTIKGAEEENVQEWRALYDYKDDLDEIDIKEGDKLTNVKEEEEGWSNVTKNDGTSGIVPTSYIEKIIVEDAAAAQGQYFNLGSSGILTKLNEFSEAEKLNERNLINAAQQLITVRKQWERQHQQQAAASTAAAAADAAKAAAAAEEEEEAEEVVAEEAEEKNTIEVSMNRPFGISIKKNKTHGILIAAVTINSNAARAGVKVGMKLIEINNKDIKVQTIKEVLDIIKTKIGDEAINFVFENANDETISIATKTQTSQDLQDCNMHNKMDGNYVKSRGPDYKACNKNPKCEASKLHTHPIKHQFSCVSVENSVNLD